MFLKNDNVHCCILQQNNLFKAREGKYQLRMNALETLAVGTTEENEVLSFPKILMYELLHF